MKIYTIHTTQNLPITLKEAWNFLSDAKNLKEITPKHMGFEIIADDQKSIYPGKIIQYRLTPMMGIYLKWVTEITHVKDCSYFVDEQRFGPYSFWHHKHFIKEINGGVEMEDIVDYKIPMGVIGELLHPLLVKPKLNEIFEYRRAKLIEIFGTFNLAQ
jgi:ligand-binding SRPBCC domain-containing protein